MRKMSLIVAMDADGGIGKNGTLPWSIKKDMQYFVKTTKKVENPEKRNAVLMGRKCWESIPESRRPLAGRLNIVLSRQLAEQKSNDLIITNSFESALKMLAEPPFVDSIETIWNIGGAEIYQLAINEKLVDEIHITKIYKSFDADVHLKMPETFKIDENPSENLDFFEENGLKFSFHVLKVAEN
uniref:dihydrofolate reductase n=1 Tax=Caenorhabditis japonica TaxID=281687 RepID=A0A8R1DS64_CAEJA